MAFTIQEHAVPDELLGPLREFTGDCSSAAAVQQSLSENGYLLLRGVLTRKDVIAARQEVFEQLHSVGEIEEPVIDGLQTGASRRTELPDPGQFWQKVSEGRQLRNVTHGMELNGIMQRIFNEPARGHDLMYVRPTPPGRSTRLHYDYPFFAGGSHQILTVWLPLGDIANDEGPLTIVEGSREFQDLTQPIQNVDYTADRSNEVVQKAAYEKQNSVDPVTFVRQRHARFLTAEFRAGDVLVFEGFTMHGSFDNQSNRGRVRLSADVRYQPAADPFDDSRYFGRNPTGSNGGGYADMRGAKPLNDPP